MAEHEELRVYPKSDYWDAQTPEFREEVLGHVITMEREYAGRLRAEVGRERAHMQSLAKWVGVPESTPSLEIACEVSSRLEDLAEHDRRVAEDAWDEGFQDGRRQDAEGDDGPRFVNPYRAVPGGDSNAQYEPNRQENTHE